MVNFSIDYDAKLLQGRATYLPEEYAFQTVPKPPFWNSLLLDTLEITLDIDRRVTGIWGYCPHTSWTDKQFEIPPYRAGGVFCDDFQSFQKRLPVDVDNQCWSVFINRKNGWIRIGESNEDCELVEVISGLVMAIDARSLCNVWIRVGNWIGF